MDKVFGDSSQTVFIPSRELTGTREEKLVQLDEFLVQLHAVRLALGGKVTPRPNVARAERHRETHTYRRSGRPAWWLAGICIALALALFMMRSWTSSPANGDSAVRAPAVAQGSVSSR
jgi:hypothetical protein